MMDANINDVTELAESDGKKQLLGLTKSPSEKNSA